MLCLQVGTQSLGRTDMLLACHNISSFCSVISTVRLQVGALDGAVQAQHNPLAQHAASIDGHQEVLRQMNGQVGDCNCPRSISR